MKRGKPPKRTVPLKRGEPLRPDVEKVREFLRRGRSELTRTPLRASQGFRRVVEAEGPLSPEEWRRAVFVASEGRCILSDTRARDADDPRFHVHHVIPKRVLRARGLYAWVWDPRNGLWISERAHARQESAFARLPHTRLPAAVWLFCAELDALDGTHWATDLVRRLHPAAGSSGVSEEVSDGSG
jgi:hypothetical protein